MSLCDSCMYQYYVEQLKPCIIHREDCEFYEPDDFHKEPKTEKVIKMRNATPEEQKSVDNYIKSISKPTGVNFGVLEKEPCINIPFLLHKEFGCPLDECVKAYDVAIEYLRSKAKMKG